MQLAEWQLCNSGSLVYIQLHCVLAGGGHAQGDPPPGVRQQTGFAQSYVCQ